MTVASETFYPPCNHIILGQMERSQMEWLETGMQDQSLDIVLL